MAIQHACNKTACTRNAKLSRYKRSGAVFFFFLPTTSPIFKSQMFDSKFLKSTFSHSRWHRLTTRGELTAFRSYVWHLQCLHKGGYTWYYSFFFFRIVGLWKKSENLGKIQSLSAIHIQSAGPSTFRCEAQGCLASINKDRKRKRRISFLSSPLLFFPFSLNRQG